MLSNRNCFKLLVKMITASPIARCPSFKFLTMQMQPPASWAGIADRSIRDHHVRRQATQPLTILPPVAALAVGLPAQRLSRSDLVHWHQTDQPGQADDVCT